MKYRYLLFGFGSSSYRGGMKDCLFKTNNFKHIDFLIEYLNDFIVLDEGESNFVPKITGVLKKIDENFELKPDLIISNQSYQVYDIENDKTEEGFFDNYKKEENRKSNFKKSEDNSRAKSAIDRYKDKITRERREMMSHYPSIPSEPSLLTFLRHKNRLRETDDI